MSWKSSQVAGRTYHRWWVGGAYLIARRAIKRMRAVGEEEGEAVNADGDQSEDDQG